MPLLSNNRLLFIHIPKNAGKSIEEYFLGPKGPYLGKRNILNRAAKLFLNATSNRRARGHLLGSYDYTFAAQHLTYREIVSLGLLDSATLENALSFSVVRNPYDRAVSSVFHYFAQPIALGKMRVSTPAEFTAALAEWLDKEPSDHNQFAHRRSQFEYLTLDGVTLTVKNLLRYERLAEDFSVFLEGEGLTEVELGWNGRQRKSRDWRIMYDEDGRALVQKQFERDFDLLGYKI